jgi:hypothetical protein
LEWQHTAFKGQRKPKPTDSNDANTKQQVLKNKNTMKISLLNCSSWRTDNQPVDGRVHEEGDGSEVNRTEKNVEPITTRLVEEVNVGGLFG